MSRSPLVVDRGHGGALWQVRLATPKANILDETKILALTEIFREARVARDLKAILLAAEGPHFSFGASVEEHLRGAFERMIPAFSRLVLTLLESEVFTLAAVRGFCLGGGLELASFAGRIVAHPDTRLGQPEIRLGVFPLVATVWLAGRVGQQRAEDLCASGREVDADEALRIGLVDEISEEPEEAALAWANEHLLSRSASSLRLALRATRLPMLERFRSDLAAAERLYLGELMATHDAVEGLEAFLARREPRWNDT